MLTTQTAATSAKATLVSWERNLDAALLNLQGSVAQGRAVLATMGIKLARKPKKKVVEAVKPVPAIIPVAA